MIDFTDLHLHSTFSTLDAFGTPAQIVKRAKEIGRKSLALTDHGSVSGLIQLKKATDIEGLHPIYGCEMYMVISLGKMRDEKIREKSHITILAQNLKGYHNLLQLVSKSYQQGFYYRPTIDAEMLFQHQEGLFVFSGCWSGMVQKALQNDDLDSAQRIINSFKDVFGDRYYLETQQFPLFQKTFSNLQYLSKKLSIPMVLTCDPHYLQADQSAIQEVLHAIRDRRKFDEKLIIEGAYQWPAEDLYKAVTELYPSGRWQEMFENTCNIAEQCNIDLPKGDNPIYPFTNGETAYNVLIAACKNGIVRRGFSNLSANKKEIYNERVKKELKLIKDKKFSDYFLIVADAVNWAKNNDILTGPARGSAAGSIVCFLTGITEIDPIKHELLFERFLDETRYDPPDIDIDFEDEKKDKVRDYLVQRYGADRVCGVNTFAKFKGKNSLDEVGKVFSIPPGDIEVIKQLLVERSGADMRLELTIQDTFEMSPEAKAIKEKYKELDYAIMLEGQTRHMGQHAAGIIVGDRPLKEVIALYNKEGEDTLKSSVEMDDAKTLNLLKIDVLGITELNILKNVLDQIGWTIRDLYALPLDDEETIKGFREVDVEGIFQFVGDSTKSVLRQIPNLNNFNQLVDCVALSKPGPAHCVGRETLIYDCDRNEVVGIGTAYKRGIISTLSLYPNGDIKPQKIKKIHKIGSWNKNKQKTFRIVFKNGRILRATAEHQFLTPEGFKKLSDLFVGDKIVSTNKKIWNRDTVGISKSNSGSYKKGSAPWNKDQKWPWMSEKSKELWKDGIYNNNPEKYHKWMLANPGKHEEIRLLASKIRSEQLAKMTPEERREELANFIEAGTKNGYGKWGDAEDGHRCESYLELAFERFLIKNNISHEPHPRLGNRRKADQKIQGIFVELDGMNRTQDYWDMKYQNGEPYLVITLKDNWKEKLAFVFEEVGNHDWYSIGTTEVLRIEESDDSVVYDLEMEDFPNYLANGIVVHNSGGTSKYISRARGEKAQGLDWHPLLNEITKSTYNQIIYQEQVLRIVKEIGKLSFTDANKVRNAMAHSEGEDIFKSFWESFKKGAIENGLTEQQAWKIWEETKTMGRWSFNRSHAVSYAILAFWIMYMKRHFPLEFYFARLAREDAEDKRFHLLLEMHNRGIKILSPRLGVSKANWSIENGSLRAGLTCIKGIGSAMANKLIESGCTSKLDFSKKKIKGFADRGIERLEIAGAFNDDTDAVLFFGLDRYNKLDTIIDRVKLVDIKDHDAQYNIKVAGIFKEMNYKDIFEERRSRGHSTSNIKDPEKSKYAMLLLEDETDRCLVNIDRYLFDRIGNQIWDAYNNNRFITIEGIKVGGWRMVRAKKVTVFSDEKKIVSAESQEDLFDDL